MPSLDANSKSIVSLYEWIKVRRVDETGALLPVPFEWHRDAQIALYACQSILREIGLIKQHERYFQEAPDQVGWRGDVIVDREQASPPQPSPSAE